MTQILDGACRPLRMTVYWKFKTGSPSVGIHVFPYPLSVFLLALWLTHKPDPIIRDFAIYLTLNPRFETRHEPGPETQIFQRGNASMADQ